MIVVIKWFTITVYPCQKKNCCAVNTQSIPSQVFGLSIDKTPFPWKTGFFEIAKSVTIALGELGDLDLVFTKPVFSNSVFRPHDQVVQSRSTRVRVSVSTCAHIFSFVYTLLLYTIQLYECIYCVYEIEPADEQFHLDWISKISDFFFICWREGLIPRTKLITIIVATSLTNVVCMYIYT